MAAFFCVRSRRFAGGQPPGKEHALHDLSAGSDGQPGQNAKEFAMNDTSSKDVVLVNVFTPKEGMAEEFARAQVADFERLGSRLDGAYQNRLYLSLNNANRPRVINIAHFENLDVFYRTTDSPDFREHLEKIAPLLDDREPMLCQLLWASDNPADQHRIDGILKGTFPTRVAENQKWIDQRAKEGTPAAGPGRPVEQSA
jgi:hypothetical protein